MRRLLRSITVAALVGSLAGCSDFLSGPSVSEDPNNPNPDLASPDNLFGAFQAAQFTSYTSTLAFTICGYVQQCKGINGRFLETQLVEYNTNPGTFGVNWDQIYRAGGLRDLRLIQEKLAARPESSRDPVYEGMVKVWEALIMSEAADKWGDIPYSEAANAGISTPGTPGALDDQLAVYTRTKAVLDTALALFASATKNSAAPDFVYGGNRTKWTALANTLKARIMLHTLRHPQVCGVAMTGCDATLDSIITYASAGIPLGAAGDNSNDFRVVVSGQDAQQQNGWFQCYEYSGFCDADLRAGDFFVTLLAQRNDPRFSTYLAELDDPDDVAAAVAAGDVTLQNGCPVHARPGENVAMGCTLARVFSAVGGSPSFEVPWVTGDENALILAEAQFRRGVGAQATLDAVRAKYGLPSTPASIPSIIEEKYVALFQNPEVWNDWKRTGCPALVSTSTQALGPRGAEIPRRVYYGQQEQDLNPNIPNASVQTGSGGPNQPNFRNDNDPEPNPTCA